MAICAGCGNKKLEWVQDPATKKWKLYDVDTGVYHHCLVSAADLKKAKEQKAKKASCPHGILKDRWCDLCNE